MRGGDVNGAPALTAPPVDPDHVRMTPGKAFLTPEEIRSLSPHSYLWSGALLLNLRALIFGAVGLIPYSPNAVTFLLAVVVIGSRQPGVAIQMREAAPELPRLHTLLRDKAVATRKTLAQVLGEAAARPAA